jgi:hypothetical protein
MVESSKSKPRSWIPIFSWAAWCSVLIPIATSAVILIIFSHLHLTLGENSGYMSGNTRVLNLSSDVLGISFLIFLLTWLAGFASVVGLLCHKKIILAGVAAIGVLTNFALGILNLFCLIINGFGC